MNTNYIKTKEAAYVTDDAGKMKEIPMTNMTQILLVEENKEESESNKETNSNVSTNSSSIQGGNIDKTTASTKQLPAAGLRNVLIIAVVIITILMVIFTIKSRDMKY